MRSSPVQAAALCLLVSSPALAETSYGEPGLVPTLLMSGAGAFLGLALVGAGVMLIGMGAQAMVLGRPTPPPSSE